MKKILSVLLIVAMLTAVLVSCDMEKFRSPDITPPGGSELNNNNKNDDDTTPPAGDNGGENDDTTPPAGDNGGETDDTTPPAGDSNDENAPPADDNGGDNTPPADDNGGNEDENVPTDPNRIPPEVKNFQGYEFKFLLDQTEEEFELQAPEEIGSSGINKALVERNKKVESLYNVKISNKTNVNGANGSFAFLDSMDRSEEYFADVYSMYAIKMIQSHATAGFYLNLCDLNSLRLDQEWWDQDFNAEFMINDHLYTMTGDIQVNDDLHEIFLAMNLDLYQETYPEKNLYEIVTRGEWTFTEFYNTWYGFDSSDGGKSQSLGK